MKNVLICILVLLCAMPISAQRNKKLETKAKTYAEKYERVGNELTISFVEENIPMSRQEIYSVFPALLDKQFNIHDDEIESRDALGKSADHTPRMPQPQCGGDPRQDADRKSPRQ